MLKNKIFTVNYVDPSTNNYQEAVEIVTDEVTSGICCISHKELSNPQITDSIRTPTESNR